MKKWHIGIGIAGLVAAFYLAFCAESMVTVEVNWEGDSVKRAEASPEDETGPDEPVGGGKLYVADQEGRMVGVVLSRAHRLMDDNELYDAVSVYNPKVGLFFSIKMTNAQVLLPAKVLYANANCTGTASVRATEPEAQSGYDLAFSYNGQWHRIPGGQNRKQINYTSYVADELDAQCTAHGQSSTWAFATEPVGPFESPGEFVPPLRFVWGD